MQKAQWMGVRTACLFLGWLHVAGCTSIQPEAIDSPARLKTLKLAELMNIEVTSVSRTATTLAATAAAVDVITSEDIRRSGATTLAEALRLAPNLQVAQANAHDWAITARGFNSASVNTGSLANKLLVMIDGRSVYTPLFGGVFWDVQHVPLDDIERIEVVSGPGGTLWGANAVNGVINVITRSAQQTQGGRASIAAGPSAVANGVVRYGGAIGADLHYRAYGQRFDGASTRRLDRDGGDDWRLTQGGFRTDYRRSDKDTLTVQGDFYEGEEGTPHTAFVNGQNTLARWTHNSSPQSEWVLQFYLDRAVLTFAQNRFRNELQTADFDLQHQLRHGQQHAIVWGIGYRHMRDEVRNSGSFAFRPDLRTMRLASAFVQDEIALRSDLKLTVGTKLEHNDFTGLEAQPSVRVAWMPPAKQMAWAAVSRAVRSPSRLDTELTTRTTVGNPDFHSETVMAYEAGYRIEPREWASLSLAAFHNRYDDIRSINQTSPQTPLFFGNDQAVKSSGIELSGLFVATSRWRLRGGFTHLRKSFRTTSSEVLPFSAAFEAQDPSHQLLVQSILDLPRGVQFDVIGRYVSEIPATPLSPRIAPYATADVRLAWRKDWWEIAAIGRNLAGHHAEFASPIAAFEIPASVQGRFTVTW
ncbi:MAG TPA: TonB-dependent receptor [Thermoanaerobaculia bacterium]|nr:TonB-dependent receptor [Thermoanaerobaculia bacterium]